MRKKIENEIVSCDCCGRYINEASMFILGVGKQVSIRYKDLDICYNCQKTVLEVILHTYEDNIDIQEVFTKSAPTLRGFEGSKIMPYSLGDLGVILNKDSINEK